jgi:hypothetical protein
MTSAGFARTLERYSFWRNFSRLSFNGIVTNAFWDSVKVGTIAPSLGETILRELENATIELKPKVTRNISFFIFYPYFILTN